MKSNLYLGIAAIVLAAGVAGAACGDDDGAATVKLDMKEYSIASDATTVSAGKVKFVATNSGADEHEVILIRTDVAIDKLTVESNGRVDEAKVESAGEVEDVAPRTTKSATLTLNPGRYLIICNLPLHYGQGMRTELTVK